MKNITAMAEIATYPSTTAESPNPVSTDSNKPTSSPKNFLDLPGELRNQIYRQYFDNFQQERKIEISFKKVISSYLNIIHANSKIRSEAASILYEKYLPTDSYENIDPTTQRPRPLMQCQVAQRIKDVCALVASRDTSLPMSFALSGALSSVHTIIKHIALQTQLPQPPSERDHVAWAIFLAYDQLDALLLSFHPHATCQAPVFKTRVGEDFVVSAVRNAYGVTYHLSIEGPLAQLDWSSLRASSEPEIPEDP